MLSIAGQELLRFLMGNTSPEEMAKEKQWIDALEHQQKALSLSQLIAPDSNDSQSQSLLFRKLQDLQFFRARYSNSIFKSPHALAQWNQGQTLVNTWISENKSVDLTDLLELNQVLTASTANTCNAHTETNTHSMQPIAPPKWRSVDIYTGQTQHLPPEDLDSMMESFWNYFSQLPIQAHPIYRAFIGRYWTLSIHPFNGGNGRTSQLFSDYFLMRAGFPPQSFSNQLEISLVGHPQTKSFMTPHAAFKRFCRTISNSLHILQGTFPQTRPRGHKLALNTAEVTA